MYLNAYREENCLLTGVESIQYALFAGFSTYTSDTEPNNLEDLLPEEGVQWAMTFLCAAEETDQFYKETKAVDECKARDYQEDAVNFANGGSEEDFEKSEFISKLNTWLEAKRELELLNNAVLPLAIVEKKPSSKL